MNEKTAFTKNKKMFRAVAIIVIATVVIFLLLGAFCFALISSPGQNNTVADRAYSWKTGYWIPWITKDQADDNCTVYIEENGGFEPYLVLTSDYGWYGGNEKTEGEDRGTVLLSLPALASKPRRRNRPPVLPERSKS